MISVKVNGSPLASATAPQLYDRAYDRTLGPVAFGPGQLIDRAVAITRFAAIFTSSTNTIQGVNFQVEPGFGAARPQGGCPFSSVGIAENSQNWAFEGGSG